MKKGAQQGEEEGDKHTDRDRTHRADHSRYYSERTLECAVRNTYMLSHRA